MTNAPAQPEQGVEAARQLLECCLIPPGLYEHATVFARGANALAVKALALLPREAPAAVAWQVRPLGDKVWHFTDDPRPTMGYEKRPLFASPAPAPEAPAGALDGSDIQLLMRLKFDNHEHGARPVIEGRQEDWDRAMRLSDLGYIAIEQVSLGGRLHITRMGGAAVTAFERNALATQADDTKGEA